VCYRSSIYFRHTQRSASKGGPEREWEPGVLSNRRRAGAGTSGAGAPIAKSIVAAAIVCWMMFVGSLGTAGAGFTQQQPARSTAEESSAAPCIEQACDCSCFAQQLERETSGSAIFTAQHAGSSDRSSFAAETCSAGFVRQQHGSIAATTGWAAAARIKIAVMSVLGIVMTSLSLGLAAARSNASGEAARGSLGYPSQQKTARRTLSPAPAFRILTRDLTP
jgi:hypothetical protein